MERDRGDVLVAHHTSHIHDADDHEHHVSGSDVDPEHKNSRRACPMKLSILVSQEYLLCDSVELPKDGLVLLLVVDRGKD